MKTPVKKPKAAKVVEPPAVYLEMTIACSLCRAPLMHRWPTGTWEHGTGEACANTGKVFVVEPIPLTITESLSQ